MVARMEGEDLPDVQPDLGTGDKKKQVTGFCVCIIVNGIRPNFKSATTTAFCVLQ